MRSTDGPMMSGSPIWSPGSSARCAACEVPISALTSNPRGWILAHVKPIRRHGYNERGRPLRRPYSSQISFWQGSHRYRRTVLPRFTSSNDVVKRARAAQSGQCRSFVGLCIARSLLRSSTMAHRSGSGGSVQHSQSPKEAEGGAVMGTNTNIYARFLTVGV